MSRETKPSFAPGDHVRIVDLKKRGHVRTPIYVRDKTGTIEQVCGVFDSPEERAYGRVGATLIPLYRVRLRQCDLWSDYDGPAHDTLVLEIYEHWLRLAEERVS